MLSAFDNDLSSDARILAIYAGTNKNKVKSDFKSSNERFVSQQRSLSFINTITSFFKWRKKFLSFSTDSFTEKKMFRAKNRYINSSFKNISGINYRQRRDNKRALDCKSKT
jgi:hypothetical protein